MSAWLSQRLGARGLATHPGQHRRREPRAVDVGLHLASAIGASASSPSAWNTESCESFHPCWTRPLRRAPRVFDEAVAVDVAVTVDPLERALDVGPDRLDQLSIAGALVVRAGEQDEQRRGVDAAVVAAERHFAEGGHFAAAHLVQNLAGLGVLLGERAGRLRGREKARARRGDGAGSPRAAAAR